MVGTKIVRVVIIVKLLKPSVMENNFDLFWSKRAQYVSMHVLVKGTVQISTLTPEFSFGSINHKKEVHILWFLSS